MDSLRVGSAPKVRAGRDWLTAAMETPIGIQLLNKEMLHER
jgi:hypothetical protein